MLQNLTHQLKATELELNTAKNSWPPWLSKTLSSIKEVANKKDFSNFVVPQSNLPNTTPTFISHINAVRRESVPLRKEKIYATDTRRDSAPVIKDSQSCSSLAARKWSLLYSLIFSYSYKLRFQIKNGPILFVDTAFHSKCKLYMFIIHKLIT